MIRKVYKVAITAFAVCGMAVPLAAQDIAQIAKSDPLIITGSVGTQNTYHYSSQSNGYASPFSSMIYANLNVSLYGINMPFAISYSNSNWSYNYPHFTFSLSPTYKNWTGYLGQNTMTMSNYVMNMGFNGVGVEYNSDRIRSGAFYGVLRKAINDDPTDPMARSPQLKRMGWGFKVGYGSKRNYLDLYLLRAYDCPNSVDETWRSRVTPQENIVVGVRGGVAPLKWLSFTANAAMSVFNTDKQAPMVELTEAEGLDKIFPTRMSSLSRFAGDANMNLSFAGINASVTYRLVQPDYTSLGTYYMSNNYHSIGMSLSSVIARRVALSATFSGQADNLTKRQLYTTKGFIFGATASTRIGQHFNLAASYNGYLQNQSDGTLIVTDSSRVHRQMMSFTVTPSYNISSEKLDHTVMLSTAYSTNKDLNKFATGVSDVNSLSMGLTYDVGVKPWEMNFTASFNHQQSNGYKSTYRSEIASLGVNRSFLEEKNLNVNLTGTLCYNEVKYQMKSLSMGGNVGLSYTLKKVHAFTAQASFNKYGDVNITKTRSHLDDTDISANLSYVYTFTLLQIKSKKNRVQSDDKNKKK